MRIRKNWLSLTTTEREKYLRGVLTMKATTANPGVPLAQQYNVYDKYVLIHLSIQAIYGPGWAGTVDGGHGGPHFLAWHRKFLLEYENDLNAHLPPGVEMGIPYWDWTDPNGLEDEILQPDAFSGNGGALGSGGVISSVNTGASGQ